MASQVAFLASAAFIMDPLCIFVITTQGFFSVLLISFSCMNYFLWRLFSFFYVVVWINFSCVPQIIFLVVLRIIFNTSIENYFFIVLIIIFRCIANLFLVLQCFAGLAVEVDWFESLTSLGDHFENFASGGVLLKRMSRWNIVRERNERGFHLSYKICQELVVCTVSDEVFWTEDLIVETTKRLHDLYTTSGKAYSGT